MERSGWICGFGGRVSRIWIDMGDVRKSRFNVIFKVLVCIIE